MFNEGVRRAFYTHSPLHGVAPDALLGRGDGGRSVKCLGRDGQTCGPADAAQPSNSRA